MKINLNSSVINRNMDSLIGKSIILLIFTSLIISCGNGETDSSSFAPLHFSENEKFATVLDKNGKVWLVNWEKYSDIPKLTEVNLQNVTSIASEMAVTSDGKLWDVDNPNKPEDMGFKKPIRKYVKFGDFSMLLYKDGSIGFPIQDLFGLTSIPNPTYLSRVDLKSFPPLKDLVVGGSQINMYILGLSTDGKVYIAGGHKKANKSNLLPNVTTFIEKAVVVESLENIKTIGKLDYRPYTLYNIDKQGNVFYWKVESEDLALKKLSVKAKNILHNRLVGIDGKTYKISASDDYKSIVIDTVSSTLMPNALALWSGGLGRYYKCVGISSEGHLLAGNFFLRRNRFDSVKVTSFDKVKIGLEYFE